MSIASLPALNASLNAAAAVLLTSGWFFIRARHIAAHRAAMMSAFLCSVIFLASYLYYHAHAGVVHFQGVGLIRSVYLVILLTHTILAVVIVPMVLRTVFLAWQQRVVEHQWWARRTLPLWLYVSVTGVIIYKMLY